MLKNNIFKNNLYCKDYFLYNIIFKLLYLNIMIFLIDYLSGNTNYSFSENKFIFSSRLQCEI